MQDTTTQVKQLNNARYHNTG